MPGSWSSRKLYHFDTPREVYLADAVVISCFDARFDAVTRKFVKRIGIGAYDHVKIPGGAKSLGAPACEADRDFVLRAIRTSLTLHQPARAVFIAHDDCGAYIGAPTEAILADLDRAADFLREAEPALPVSCYFAAFDGIYSLVKPSDRSAEPAARA